MDIVIAPLAPEHRNDWEPLARGYQAFYERSLPDAEYEVAWRRLLVADDIHGLAATLDGRVVGIAHYLFHTAVWAPRVCYLQDLFVNPQTRGKGIARGLIEAIAVEARARGCARYYWNTRENNSAARLLYDKVATFNGFIRYDVTM